MKTPSAIPIFGLVCILSVVAQAANTSLTNSHARRSLNQAHHRYAQGAPRRLGSLEANSLQRRSKAKRDIVDDVVDLVPDLLPTTTTTSASSTSTDSSSTATTTTDSTSSTTTTDSASSTTTTDSASTTTTTDSSSTTTTTTDSSTSTTTTDSSTSTTTTSTTDSASSTTTDSATSTTDSASSTVTDPPASSTASSCAFGDLGCVVSSLTSDVGSAVSSIISQVTDTATSDLPISTPAPTSDSPTTTPTDTPTSTSDLPASTSTTNTPASTSNVISEILSTLTSLPTSTSDLPVTKTISDSSSPTQSDKPTETVTQSQPQVTLTDSVSVSVSQPITITQSNTVINTQTVTASDSPTDSATESVTHTASVSFPTFTSSPTDSGATATATDSIASESITDSQASLTMTTQPIPSEYSYITDASLALTSLPGTSTIALTLTDPDAAFTTASLTQSGTAAPSQAVAFPTQLPTRIFPADRLDPNDPTLAGLVLVSLKFQKTLTWSFVVSNTNTAALLFVYTPQAIANALGIDVSQVLTFAMQAFAPADYTGDITQLSTVYLLYIPADQVDALQQQLLTSNSPLYSNQAGIPKQISQQLDATFPVNAVGLDTAIVGTGNTAGSNNAGTADASSASRRDAIIGVCAAFGVILLIVVIWWGYKSWRRRQDKAHRRLTHDSAGMHQAGGYGATTQYAYGGVYGAAPQRSGYAQPHTPLYTTTGEANANPFEDSSYEEDYDERRRSFFYAEDSLRGYTVPRPEEEQGITYTQLMRQQQGLAPNDGKRRAPIQASAISAPILRESSLNW